MVLIFAPVITEVNKISKIGTRFKKIKNKVFLFFELNLNFFLNFLSKVENIIKNGSKIIICLIMKKKGYFK